MIVNILSEVFLIFIGCAQVRAVPTAAFIYFPWVGMGVSSLAWWTGPGESRVMGEPYPCETSTIPVPHTLAT